MMSVSQSAHTTPTDPSLIPGNSMYSVNTGWQQGRCRAMLALGQLRERRQESEDPPVTPGLQEGPRVTWQGLSQAARVFQSRKSKGKTTIGQLCCVPGSALWSPPGTGERHFAALQGFFFWRITVRVVGKQEPLGASSWDLLRRLS